MSETVSLDFELNGSIERVWRALTDSATLSKWTFFDTDDFQAVVGHRCHFRGKQTTGWTTTVECEVLEVDEPHRLSYTWVIEAYHHNSTVTWTLKEAGDGVTRLHLDQSGFATEAKQEIGGAKYGWMAQVDQLQKLLASE